MPASLVEQWQSELENRFNLQAVALTSATASRVEREVPHGTNLMDHFPIIVVSLDYIKSERHREHFLSIAPECIVVDRHTLAPRLARENSFVSNCCSDLPLTKSVI